MSHRCPWPGCRTAVPSTMWGCPQHWRALPNDLRAWIGRAYRYGQMTGSHPNQSWRDAHTAALAWIAQHADRQQSG
ncbi:hypothetical protein [Paraburkholderia adhaesiva]|uniref:hypothetical protein n=1 Tax=Paraburkholderia adhaesiva TaxID=2883244 RepID=UPI001F38DE56|nr:hypothetical protein [Paraburkholderia adhaesiva]